MDILSPQTVLYKTCTKCSLSKVEDKFYRNNDWCKKCIALASQNVPDGMKFCTLCKQPKLFHEFYIVKIHGVERIDSSCILCTSKRKNNLQRAKYDPLKNRDASMRSLYGISLQEYERLLTRQEGVCAICKTDEHPAHYKSKKKLPLVVDHDHETGAVRGLLCSDCNHALGFIKENKERAKALLTYIEERC